ncbi:SPOSA6832_04207 [Sporobolomyces salmonicolor]|uniref:SPOSA6832_04207-mRNA-1:cds n=1 Tax=Sporidiobolus salmonicolor TaxID=5005 RepID=A0A0D6ER19_SPOSA|nr:SPOSA6832_04207 [Sporobolomyces salmonicolor]
MTKTPPPGPDRDGGAGPYFQSQRRAIYDRYLSSLIAEGKAYHCFCTPERLTETRKRLQKQGSNEGYDRRCLGLSKDEVAKRLASGERNIVRFKPDLIYDPIQYDSLPLEDFVLRKSDGLPTYHFANVVDDHEMGITHVLRGEEWLPSTPKHLQLYDALNLERPQFAHLPLLINPDGSKLSKRAGDVKVEDYIAKGYEPEALLNFVALMGWSPQSTASPAPSSAPSASEDILPPAALIAAFSLEAVNKNRATMQTAKLDFLNRAHLKAKLVDEEGGGRSDLGRRARAMVEAKYRGEWDEGHVVRVVEALKDRIHTLHDVFSLGGYFFSPPQYDEPVAKKLFESVPAEVYRTTLNAATAVIAALPASAFPSASSSAAEVGPAEHEILDALNSLMPTNTDVGGPKKRNKAKEVMGPLRHALTGQNVGAGVPSTIIVLGRDETLARLRAALAWAAEQEKPE